jgi:hypothetical protein
LPDNLVGGPDVNKLELLDDGKPARIRVSLRYGACYPNVLAAFITE